MAIEDREWYKRFKRDEFKNTQNNARYRDVPFIIDTSGFVGGRRTVEHEYPQRDTPYSEDLGRKIRNFDVSGILLGDDYLSQRDKLVRACELGGPGEFVHPYYGVFTVICKEFTFDDTRRETRLCKFQLVLVETGEEIFPIVTVDTTGAIETKVSEAYVNNKTWFDRTYASVRKPLVFLQGKQDTLDLGLDVIDKGKKLTGVTASYVSLLTETRAETATLILSPGAMFDDVKNLIAFGIEEVIATIDFIKAFLGLQDNSMDFTADTPIVSDDTEFMEEMIQEVSLITMCLLVSKIEFTSVEDAEFYRDTVLNKIDSLLLTITDNQVMQDMRDLRKVVFEDVKDRSLELPSITTHTENLSLPAIVLSHKLYGNVDQEQDILDRNKIVNPNFLPGGVPLEVLVDG